MHPDGKIVFAGPGAGDGFGHSPTTTRHVSSTPLPKCPTRLSTQPSNAYPTSQDQLHAGSLCQLRADVVFRGGGRCGDLGCVASLKGGSAKTTTAAYLGHVFREWGDRVLLIDADPQRSLLRWAQIAGWAIATTVLPTANTLTGEHGIENAGELAVAVPNQQSELSCAVAEGPSESSAPAEQPRHHSGGQ